MTSTFDTAPAATADPRTGALGAPAPTPDRASETVTALRTEAGSTFHESDLTPAGVHPATTGRGSTDLGAAVPTPTNHGTADQDTTGPGPLEPTATDPGAAVSGTADQDTTGFGPRDTGTTGPGTAASSATDPGPATTVEPVSGRERSGTRRTIRRSRRGGPQAESAGARGSSDGAGTATEARGTVRALLRDDSGMSTVEYAIGTVAAAAFAAILYAVVSGDTILGALTGIVQRALSTTF
ncbi:DUF4244 domain-containing protein [Pseudonocardia endophytica]|uniref:Uncharacterized protein DUF4244 n=1 Tax=Pseudonocardia endophytica TaxID=401976 RepID=A0A4R1HWI1_PSEEN|nr:uncharacterized protein DUF4244 [Pseudonocardia endophytica]